MKEERKKTHQCHYYVPSLSLRAQRHRRAPGDGLEHPNTVAATGSSIIFFTGYYLHHCPCYFSLIFHGLRNHHIHHHHRCSALATTDIDTTFHLPERFAIIFCSANMNMHKQNNGPRRQVSLQPPGGDAAAFFRLR